MAICVESMKALCMRLLNILWGSAFVLQLQLAHADDGATNSASESQSSTSTDTPKSDGLSFDFTLNYINDSLRQNSDYQNPSVKVNGSTLTYTYYSYAGGYYRIDESINLLKAEAFPAGGHDVQINWTNIQNSVHFLQHTVDSVGQDAGGRKIDDRWDNAVVLNVETDGNEFKKRDVANAVNHLVVLLKAQRAAEQAQHEADLRRQEQENRSDPFANP